MGQNTMKFTLHDARKALGDVESKKLINRLQANRYALTVSTKVVESPAKNRYGPMMRRSDLIVFDSEEVKELYRHRIDKAVVAIHIPSYKRIIAEIETIENL